jgi:hypothetical protein
MLSCLVVADTNGSSGSAIALRWIDDRVGASVMRVDADGRLVRRHWVAHQSGALAQTKKFPALLLLSMGLIPSRYNYSC